ncbi:MAG: FTR1 family protein [Anaerolineales bacterium]|nr:FTR1 family protein [Anaerolineales bacterium]
MLAAFLITFREGLEAALIISIVTGYLVKIGQPRLIRTAWAGAGAAGVISVLTAVVIMAIGAELEGTAEQIFEGTTMFLAVAVLTWMIFWMRTQARLIKQTLEREVLSAVTTGTAWGLFGLTFVAVVREGVETALFLSASAFLADGLTTLAGAGLGLAAAAVTGYLLYASTARLNVRAFFDVTSLLLLFFAAGLLGHGVHEFQEAGLLPLTIEHLWDINFILSETSPLGEILKALFGYNGNPSLLEVLSYASYWVVTLLGVRWWVERRAAPVSALPR